MLKSNDKILHSAIFFFSFILLNVTISFEAGSQAFFKPESRQRPEAVCLTPYLDSEYLEAVYKNTLENSPEVFETPLYKPSWLGKGSEHIIGDSMEFWGVNIRENEYYRIMAELKTTGNKILIWVEKTELDSGRVTDSFIQSMLTAFEVSTPPNSVDPSKGIIEIENEYFGLEPDKDGDGKTDILLFEIQDYYNGTTNNTYVAGFFSPSDQGDGANSNQRDMLYLDTYPGISTGGVLGTASHEYQHLIHYNYDSREINLINEGAAQLAQTITGQLWDDPGDFFVDTDRGLLYWAPISDASVLADYSKVQMFMLYLYEQFGKDFVQTLVQDPVQGIPSIESALTTYGNGLTFNDVLRNWYIANYLNDVGLDPKYGYYLPAAQVYHASDLKTETNYPAIKSYESLSGYAADYIKFKNGSEFSGSFTSSIATFAAIKAYPGAEIITYVSAGEVFSAPDFGTGYDEITFICMNETENSTHYSYEFDSYQPYFLQEVKYDNGTPAVVVGTQRGIWWGTNTPGFQWAVKFSPLNEESFLLGAKAYLMVDTTFMGGSGFTFHVYDNSGPNGEPGSDIITPVPVNIQHSTELFWWEIDLLDYEGQLSQYHDDFYIALEHPPSDTNAVFLAVDNYTPTENHSWAFRGPVSSSPGWSSIENDDLGGTSLAPFDIMMRATMSFLELDTPVLTGGFLQHPVFTENFEIYVVGGKLLNQNRLQGTITVGGETETLNLISTGSTGRVFVDNEVEITQSGTISLNFSGAYEYGNIITDTLFQFSVQSIDASVAGKISNPSGTNSLLIPSNSISNRTTFTAHDGLPFIYALERSGLSEYESEGIGEPTTFGPSGLNKGDFELQFRFSTDDLEGKDPAYIALCRFENGAWKPLESRMETTSNSVKTITEELGTFQLRWSKNFTKTLPEVYSLEQNYPNPFNSMTTIRFSLEQEGLVTIRIFDITGREIKTVTSSNMRSGPHSILWDGTNSEGKPIASGVYIYQIKSGTFVNSKKMIYLK